MDWSTIGIVAIAALGFTINFVPIRKSIAEDVDSDVAGIFLGALGAAFAFPLEILVVLVVLEGLQLAITGVGAWGVGNFLVSVLVVGIIVSAPYIGKPLILRLLVGIPHYIQKFFAECKTYKAELETKAPIRRSVYELVDE